MPKQHVSADQQRHDTADKVSDCSVQQQNVALATHTTSFDCLNGESFYVRRVVRAIQVVSTYTEKYG